jgi:hypothetical protein
MRYPDFAQLNNRVVAKFRSPAPPAAASPSLPVGGGSLRSLGFRRGYCCLLVDAQIGHKIV